MKLWYKQPAQDWNQALPIGNGHLGGMVYGGVEHDTVKLNDETIWYRGKANRNNPDAASHLQEIRELIATGKIREAEQLVTLTMFATPRDQSHYETLGELFINQTCAARAEAYERSLDLDRAIASVRFESDGVQFARQYYVSHESNALYVRLEASRAGALEFTATLGRVKRFSDYVKQVDGRGIIMAGQAGGAHGVAFQVGLTVVETDGTVEVLGETVVVRGGTTAVLAVCSASDYHQVGGEDTCAARLGALGSIIYDDDLDAHTLHHREQFDRVSVSLAYDASLDELATDERLNRVRAGERDLGLLQLAFDYGRYLIISSSQPGGLPANLQGIWCEDINPIWGSKYTSNVNVEMNYWLCGPCDLPEAQLPLFDALEAMRAPGRVTARTMYNARGFTAHHNFDGFFDTAPQSHAMGAAIWPFTVPWMLTHIWEHYRFFVDEQVLRDHYAMFQEAALFYEDYLFEYQGMLVSGPSASPENRYRLPDGTEGQICFSPTCDCMILRFFFDCCIDIARLLGDTSDFSERVRRMRDRLPKTRIGKHGQVQEWLEDYDEPEPGHRHMSHLFGLHPGNEISLDRTPELAAAALTTIRRRLNSCHRIDRMARDQEISAWKGAGISENAQTEWSEAWLAHFFARLRLGEDCIDQLFGLLGHNTLDNMLSDSPPMQVDGNMGLSSALCEMLLQSHEDAIVLLPGVSPSLPKGSFTGLRARGGYKVSARWDEGCATYVEVQGRPGARVLVRIPAQVAPDGVMVEKMLVCNEKGYTFWEI